jgi:predicted Zn finger-like uncharacterized protein
MPITLNCPKCHKPFRVRDESIGGRVRCPSCGAVLQVPAALSPASHFDDLPRGESPSQSSKPLAEGVKASVMGSLNDVGLGGPSRREEAVDLGPPPGAAGAGPPSIKAPAVPPQGPLLPTQLGGRQPAQASKPSAPAPEYRARPTQPPPEMKWLPSGDEAAWRKVRGGLGLIRCALFLLTLVFLAACGHAVWIAFDTDRALSNEPGLLKQAGWPLWKEALVAYVGVFSVPAILLLLFGRLRCGGAPASANARGLAYGAAFFTIVAILAAAFLIGMQFFNLGDKIGEMIQKPVPPQAQLTAQYVLIPAAVLAEVFTLLFIGQIGWPLSRPQLQKSIAGFFAYAAILPAAVLIGMQYYPVIGAVRRSMDEIGTPLGGPDDDLAQRVLIWGVVLLTAGVMLFLRYASVAGQARRAIRKLLSGEA